MFVNTATSYTYGQWQLQSREFYKQTVNPGNNPGPEIRVSAFKARLQSHFYDVVWIHSHGGADPIAGDICIEPYQSINSASNAYWTYI